MCLRLCDFFASIRNFLHIRDLSSVMEKAHVTRLNRHSDTEQMSSLIEYKVLREIFPAV